MFRQVEDLMSLDFDALTQKEDFLEELVPLADSLKGSTFVVCQVPDILTHAGCTLATSWLVSWR